MPEKYICIQHELLPIFPNFVEFFLRNFGKPMFSFTPRLSPLASVTWAHSLTVHSTISRLSWVLRKWKSSTVSITSSSGINSYWSITSFAAIVATFIKRKEGGFTCCSFRLLLARTDVMTDLSFQRLDRYWCTCSICGSIDHLAFEFVATWCLTVLQHVDQNGGTCFVTVQRCRFDRNWSTCTTCLLLDHLAFSFVATWFYNMCIEMEVRVLLSNSPGLRIGSKLKCVYDSPVTWLFGLLIRSDVMSEHMDRNGGTCFCFQSQLLSLV